MNIKKLIACLLALVLVLCALPMVFAAGQSPDAGSDSSDIEVPVGDAEQVPDVEILYGDANGDKSVTMDDALAVLRFAAGWEIEVDEVASNVNGDASVTMDDALLILRSAAGWEVTLGPAA